MSVLFFLSRSSILCFLMTKPSFPSGAMVKNPPANAEDARDEGSVPGSGGSPGGGHGNPLQYCCLGNPMDRGAWRAAVHGIAKSWTPLRTHTHTHTHTHTRLNQGEQSMSRNWGPQDQARAVGRKTKPGFEPPFWFGLCEDEDRAGL